MFKKLIFFVVFLFLIVPSVTVANVDDQVLKARVVDIVKEEKSILPDTTLEVVTQSVKAEILEGDKRGSLVIFDNDYIRLENGATFFLSYSVDEEGIESYSVVERDRTGILLLFLGLFIIVILLFGRKQGLRSLISLAGSLFILSYVMIPSLLAGYPPIITSTFLAGGILFLAIFITHGFNRKSLSAFMGTVIGVTLTSLLAYLSVNLAHFTGLGSEEATYLSVVSAVQIDFSGLLLGGIIIGVLGVLDDIAITQVAVVRELYQSTNNLTKKEIYYKALKIGREHVGALVNTLALAYTGAALPILLLFSASVERFSLIVSQEIFSVEIIRTIVGSIGLIMTVPITTFLAVVLLEKYKGLKNEHSHLHSHSHSLEG